MNERCCNCSEPAAGGIAMPVLEWGVEVIRHYCGKCADKKSCRCPSEFCRLEPDNCPEMCPELGQDEICGYR